MHFFFILLLSWHFKRTSPLLLLWNQHEMTAHHNNRILSRIACGLGYASNTGYIFSNQDVNMLQEASALPRKEVQRWCTQRNYRQKKAPRKYKRTPLTPEHLQFLNEHWIKSQNPTRDELQKMAAFLQIPSLVVSRFFRRKRYNCRKNIDQSITDHFLK